ncbi:MAG: ShlB/FhaC/HecB family hemolysin secretion/activation protein [Pseudomonadota bacterium]
MRPFSALLRPRKLLVAFTVFLMSGTVAAQQEEFDPALVGEIKFDIRDFVVTGENPLPEKVTQSLFTDLIGDQQSLGNIQVATERLESRLRQDGFSFYRVSAPPQDLSDAVVKIEVERFEIDRIVVQGNLHFSDENIRRSLPSLRAGNSPNTKKLARYLAVANSNPSKNTRITVSKGDQENLIDLAIKVVDYSPRSVTAYLNNTGGGSTSDYRIGVGFQHNNLFDRDHVGSATVTTSPDGFDTVRQIGLTYHIPIYSTSGAVSFFGVDSNIDSGRVGEFFDVSGKGKIYGVRYTHYLPKWKQAKQQLSLQLMDKLFDNDIDFLGESIGQDVRSRPLSLRYQIEKNFDDWRATGFAEVINNISGGSENTDEAYEATRTGATPDWQSWQLGGSFSRHLGKWVLNGKVGLHGSSDRLITGEQFGAGGAVSVRGFEEREVRGDQMVTASLQVWAPQTEFNLRPGFFLDYARLKNNDPVESELDNESIASVGLNMVWQGDGQLFVRASAGYAIDGNDTETGITRDGDSKFHISVGKRWGGK